MALPNDPLPWQLNPDKPYCPIMHQGKVVGFGRPRFANRVVNLLNEEEKLLKAMKLACRDLLTRMGRSPDDAEELMAEYLARATRPKSGVGAIVVLLLDRQAELDISADEFAKFCDSYKLSRSELSDIYAGKELNNTQLGSLSRILGRSIDDVLEIWHGTS